jgi:hypothetical protein
MRRQPKPLPWRNLISATSSGGGWSSASGINMKTSIVALGATLLLPCISRAQSDPFLEAVAFALTGDDNAKVQVIVRANCVFGIKNEVFRLNNVHIDRVTTAEVSWQGLKHLEVELHGRPRRRKGIAHAKKDDPAAFQRRHTKSNEHKIVMYTTERERVIRAWQYLYAHGCSGAKSPF